MVVSFHEPWPWEPSELYYHVRALPRISDISQHCEGRYRSGERKVRDPPKTVKIIKTPLASHNSITRISINRNLCHFLVTSFSGNLRRVTSAKESSQIQPCSEMLQWEVLMMVLRGKAGADIKSPSSCCAWKLNVNVTSLCWNKAPLGNDFVSDLRGHWWNWRFSHQIERFICEIRSYNGDHS